MSLSKWLPCDFEQCHPLLWGGGILVDHWSTISSFPLLNAGFEPKVSDTYSPADWMPADKPTELSRIKLKTWTRQPVPMISKHSAHSTSLLVGFRTWLWRYTCLLLLISMLWHRQAIFESKGDNFFSSAECRIRTQGLRHLFASRLNACWQTDWAIEDQAKNLNSTARPYDQQAFSPLDLTASWLSHLALAICMFVVVNFDALAQASDIRIERRQVVSSAECRIRIQGLRHLFASRPNACWQTDWAIEDQAKNLNSTARPYDQQAFSPLDLTASWLSHLALAIYMFVVVNFDALAQASDIRIERRQVVFLCWMQNSNPRSQTPIRQQTECIYTCLHVCVRLEMCVYVQMRICTCMRVSMYKWVLFCFVFVVRLASQLGCVV